MLVTATLITSSAAGSDCPGNLAVLPSVEYRISTDGSVVKAMRPDFFGFNLESVSFFRSLVFPNTQIVRPMVIRYMSAFPGAVYRYPGGVTSNYYDWKKNNSAKTFLPNRQPYQLFWLNFPAYMNFVSRVNGRVWLTANLNGNMLKEERPARMATLAASWATQATKYQQAGQPAVLRWELGNELDRGANGWRSAKYVARAKTVAEAIRSAAPKARFVAMLEDYSAHHSESATQYNVKVAQGLAGFRPNFAQHLYYDGMPGPSVAQKLKFLCGDIRAVDTLGMGSPRFWITESGVGPPVPWSKFNTLRDAGGTLNMGAAISEADMLIALSQIPQVKGMFIHQLAGVGAWSLFLRVSTGQVKPTVPYWGLRVLREALLGDVLATVTRSRNDSDYAGRYDLRASILSNPDRSAYTVWASNRSGKTIAVRLQIPGLAGKTYTATLTSVSNRYLSATDDNLADRVLPSEHRLTLIFDRHSVASLSLPAYSVSALEFHSSR